MTSTLVAPLRTAAGGLSLFAGAVLLLGPPSGELLGGVFAGLVMLAGGLALTLWDRLGLSGWAVAVAAAVAGAAGTAAGYAVSSTRVCCMFAYTETRGWPYAWLSRNGEADTVAGAIQLAEAGGWTFSGPGRLLGDAVVWAYAGVVLIAVISAMRGTRRE